MSESRSSGFAIFCCEWMSSKEKEGHHFPDVSEVIADEERYKDWKKLPEDVKDYYRLLGKCSEHQMMVEDQKNDLSRSRSSNVDSSSRQSTHRSSRSSGASSLRSSKLNGRRFRCTVEEYMTLMMNPKKESNTVQKLKFYLAHANYFYFREMGHGQSDYYPAEIAIAECSLEKGVQRVHHVIVKEDIVKGYRNDAVTRSQESHKIPIDFDSGKIEVQTDYSEIYQGICKFLEAGANDDEFPPLFTLKSNDQHIWKPVRSIFKRLAVADSKPADHLIIYSFEELFAIVYNAVHKTDKSEFDVVKATEMLEKDPNAYRNGFGCEFHQREKEGEHHCSTSFVKRWFYRLCHYCCEPLGIAKVPGQHEPVELEQPGIVFSKLNLRPKYNPRDPRNHKRYFNCK